MHPAADDPATQAALTGYQAGAIRWLAGGVIAVVLGFLAGAAAVAVAESGRRLPGVGLVVVVLIVGGLAAAVAGTGALLRARRWRRGLTRGRAGSAACCGSPVPRSSRSSPRASTSSTPTTNRCGCG